MLKQIQLPQSPKELEPIKELNETDPNQPLDDNFFLPRKYSLVSPSKKLHIFLFLLEKNFNLTIKFKKSTTVIESKKVILSTFNKYFQKANLSITLDPAKLTEYKLYPAKKNGYPKLELPQLDDAQLLYSTNLQNFALIF